MSDEAPLKRVPVVPPARKPGDPIPEIHATRDLEDNPWLESFINLDADKTKPESGHDAEDTGEGDSPRRRA